MYLNLAILRFYLAVSVMIFHLYRDIAPQAGTLAVFCFFMISGFLIVNLIEETYKDRYKEFIINRFLRIYPTYLFAMILGFIVVSLYPIEAKHINPVMMIPRNLNIFLDNLFIFDLYGQKQRLVPVAWSLNTELNFYIFFLVISFLSLKLKKLILFVLPVFPFLFVYENLVFYGHFFGSAIAFSFGALYYYFRDRININKYYQYMLVILIPFVMFVIPKIFNFSGARIVDNGWINEIVIIVILFFSFQFFLNKSTNDFYNKIALFLGSISYPLFLLHWIGSVLTYKFFNIERNSLEHLLIAGGISILLSIIAYLLIEKPLFAYRTRIRNKK